MKSRNKDMDALIDGIIEIDVKRRELTVKADGMKSEQNAASKEIPRIKKEGGDVSAIMARMNALKEQIKEIDAELSALEDKQKAILLEIPNIPHESVPKGASDADNLEIRRFGEPRDFGFEPKPHWELGEALGILTRAAKGNRHKVPLL